MSECTCKWNPDGHDDDCPVFLKDENARLQSEVERLRGRCGELSNLCERLQHCAQGFYVDQGDYGHMEAIMQDYHAIMRGDSAQSRAFRMRVQAEAVEEFGVRVAEGALDEDFEDGDFAAGDIQTMADRHGARLRQQADEAEKEKSHE